MTESPLSDYDRLLHLLAEQALAGLETDQQSELASLLQMHPDFDMECLDRTAALLDWAVAAGDTQPLPQPVQDRIRAEAGLDLQTRPDVGDGSGDPTHEIAGRMHRREVVAWLAAAACLLVAVLAWYNRPTLPLESPTIANIEPPATLPGTDTSDSSTTRLTIAQQREQLLASAPDVLHLRLVNNESGIAARQPGGDIVWSSGLQIGYLRLQGLANNELPQHQYQLWIIGSDASSNEVVNGGMFYVDRNTSELILPIQVDHFVQQPKVFVVNVEPLGGGSALTDPLLARADGVGP